MRPACSPAGRGLAWVLALGLGVAGCGRTRPGGFVWARTPAAGATSTCPDDAVDLTGDGTPTTDHVRCSYADAGAVQAHVQGTVLVDEPGGLGRAAEAVEVVLVRVDEQGRTMRVVSARTDAQGGFSLRAAVRPGTYALVVGGTTVPSWRWDGRGPWSRDAEVLRIPAEDAARGG